MFFRTKRVKDYVYVQIAESRWEEGRSRQRIIATLGRLDQLEASGRLEALLESGSRLAQGLLVLAEHQRGEVPTVTARRIGPALVFDRLWRETGCQAVIEALLEERQFGFSVERAIFLEALHRLVSPGSDRDGYAWKQAYRIEGVEELELHHAYRAMAWLGEPLDEQGKQGEALAPRCVKDLIEERLFERRRSLFSALDLVFFDTTSIYFEGAGGESLGQHGHSKDHRPDLKQMVVGVVMDQEGVPMCCELWPGNTADVTTLTGVVERLRRRFAIERVCIVADRGMVSKKTVEALEAQGWPFILGARMRSVKQVRDEVLSHGGRYQVVVPRGAGKRSASPLKVKEVSIGEHRYVVCLNEDQARKDAADREAIVASLRDRLRRGPKSLVGNKGYRKYVKSAGAGFVVDEARIEREARYDGKWVLWTNTQLEPAEVALSYKQLWMVEDIFRSMKTLLATRPIYHRTDEAIRGHVFCSFLALRLRAELEDRLAAKGYGDLEWASVVRDIDRLEEVELEKQGKRFVLRTEVQGVAGKVFQAAGVALPPTIRQVA